MSMTIWRRSSSPSMAVKSPRESIRLSASSAGMLSCFARLCILSLLCSLILQNKLCLRCRKRHGHMPQYQSDPLRKTCARLESSSTCRTVAFRDAPMPGKNGRRGRSSNIFFFTTVYCRDTVFHLRLDGMADWRCGNRFLLLTEWALAILISVTKGGRMNKPTDLVQGTLDLLILKILALEPLHGWAAWQRLKQVSGDVLQVSDGSPYPALHKLEHEGWITAEWKPSENNRRAKFYSLTGLGREELENEAANWNRLSTAISRVVKLKEA